MIYSFKYYALFSTVALGSLFSCFSVSSVQAATTLPGGASTLTETFSNWTVSCRVVTNADAKNVVCTMLQQQIDENGRRALTAEFTPAKSGLAGAFLLPFGLDLKAAPLFQVDENKAGVKSAFSTCMPAGCLVPVNFDVAQSDAMYKGKALIISTKSLDGQEFKFNVPLDGFAAASKRIQELTK
ncbi:invasion associated locus B family protein [Pseudochrobactrum sp. HB0163]|uniref:invasion associated locus B family protein n=1 Tax=Pseudochrobactrum sp. HB0163 TaxID=3450708 RepID=UPI003F6E1086